MKSRILVFFLLIIFTTAASLKHDDLIVAVGDQLEFIFNGTTPEKLSLESYNASKLSALAYDATTRKLFFSDKRSLRGHIFSVVLNDDPQPVEDIVEKTSNETVDSLTYDPVEQMLLWTDGFNRSIRRVKIDPEHVHVKESSSIELVHFLEKDDRPRGLVSDPCTRMLYWTNRYMLRPTIERSHLDGRMREIIVQANLTLPHALDLDVKEQKLYWADNLRSGYFQIERSFVNGSGRELVYRGIGQFIVGLTVGEDYVYWSDYDHKKLWSLPKDGCSNNPVPLRQYIHSPAMSLVVFRQKPLNCGLVSPLETYQADRVFDNREIQEEHVASYEDIDLCLGFCYNNGKCIVVNDNMQCSCPDGFHGDRCELVIEKSNDWTYYALVGEIGRTEAIALISLAVTCVILLAVVIFLTIRLWKLQGNKRPRGFKRRCLPRPNNKVNESSNSPAIQDLENCCNSFTMCERPSYQCPQQANIARENDWQKDGDNANLLRYEF